MIALVEILCVIILGALAIIVVCAAGLVVKSIYDEVRGKKNG